MKGSITIACTEPGCKWTASHPTQNQADQALRAHLRLSKVHRHLHEPKPAGSPEEASTKRTWSRKKKPIERPLMAVQCCPRCGFALGAINAQMLYQEKQEGQ